MKNRLILPSVLTFMLISATVRVQAQAVGRIRQQANRAVNATQAASGQEQAPVPIAPPVDPQAVARVQAQLAAQQAALAKRNKENLVGADQRIVEFLKKRIEDGSADAPVDLAKRYEDGKGVEADPDEARRLYFVGEERGNESAKVWLKEHPGLTKAELEAKIAKNKKTQVSLETKKSGTELKKAEK